MRVSRRASSSASASSKRIATRSAQLGELRVDLGELGARAGRASRAPAPRPRAPPSRVNPSFASLPAERSRCASTSARCFAQPGALGVDVEQARRELHEPAGERHAWSSPAASPPPRRRPPARRPARRTAASACEATASIALGRARPHRVEPFLAARCRAADRNCRTAVTTSCTSPSARLRVGVGVARDAAPATRRSRATRARDPEALPDLLGDERHDGVQQAQRALQHPGEDLRGVGAAPAPSPSSRPFSISRPQSQNSDHMKR